ncbi:hypothetical protein SLA2020_034340 [Shorea laevis]
MDGKKLEYKGEEALKEIEKLTAKADEVQEDILKEILQRNGETEYLNKHMKGSKDVLEFKHLVPVITYKYIYPYIHRIANGEDSSLITGHPITEMLCSSGTSGGEPKLMPSIAEDLDRRTFIYNLIMPIMNQYISGLDEGKAMFLYFIKTETSTPCGLPARAVLTSYYKSKHFKCRTRDPFNDFTSPDQAILCPDSNQSMYCQLLSGLLHRHKVMRLGAVFATAFLRAISFLERKWVQLCSDIRTGQLDLSITDPGCRSSMLSLLSSPNPNLANEIEDICSSPSWNGILCHLWPRAKYIEAVVTGSMAQYIPALEYYSGGKLPLMKEEVDNGMLVDLVNVKLGNYYELVITTFSGLNRYRIGDVLQVTGFHKQAPQFRFICRRNVVLSIDTDKTNEEDLHRSISTAKRLLEPYNALLVEYTSYADTSSMPGHYVLFWEIQMVEPGPIPIEANLLQECCITVEEELDYIYRRCRSYDKSVGPLEIRIVETRTFEALMDLLISQGGSINQYKTPRCIKSNSALKLLNSHVTASFFSPRDPKWTP